MGEPWLASLSRKIELEDLQKDLLKIEYPFLRVTKNKGYQAFLK